MNWPALLLFLVSLLGGYILIANMGLGKKPAEKKDESPAEAPDETPDAEKKETDG